MIVSKSCTGTSVSDIVQELEEHNVMASMCAKRWTAMKDRAALDEYDGGCQR